MSTETYRGVRLKVRKGSKWGHLAHYVNGQPWGEWEGSDEAAALASMHGYVDLAIEEPARMADYWQPGYKARHASPARHLPSLRV